MVRPVFCIDMSFARPALDSPSSACHRECLPTCNVDCLLCDQPSSHFSSRFLLSLFLVCAIAAPAPHGPPAAAPPLDPSLASRDVLALAKVYGEKLGRPFGLESFPGYASKGIVHQGGNKTVPTGVVMPLVTRNDIMKCGEYCSLCDMGITPATS